MLYNLALYYMTGEKEKIEENRNVLEIIAGEGVPLLPEPKVEEQAKEQVSA
ncbi:MAG: hypothetical protein LBP41_01640 [Holosporaceae bacterium]|jgi:hypothetical protein|nr:hypothetical protein [Holosporaceae bacterium]